MRILLTYIALVVALWFALSWATGMAKYQQLANVGVQASGKVESITCENHASFQYEYFVKGRRIISSGKSSEGGLRCADLAVGQSIPVVYLESSPEESIAGSAGSALSEARLFAAGMSVTFPAIGLWLKRRKRAEERVA